MARLVKCKFCKEQKDINEAYKAILYNSKGTPSNAYFCNEEHYQDYRAIEEEKERLKKIKIEAKKKEEEEKQKREADKNKLYSLVCEILGRKEIINTILWKERAIWNRVATDEVISKYLEENKKYLTDMIARLDNIEYNRIRYLSAILKNNLGDFKPKAREIKKIIPVVQEEHYETKFKNKKKRKGFEDLEEEFDE